MNIIDFVEEVMDVTRGTHGGKDGLPVLFEDKEGIEHQIDNVVLTNSGLFILEKK